MTKKNKLNPLYIEWMKEYTSGRTKLPFSKWLEERTKQSKFKSIMRDKISNAFSSVPSQFKNIGFKGLPIFAFLFIALIVVIFNLAVGWIISIAYHNPSSLFPFFLLSIVGFVISIVLLALIQIIGGPKLKVLDTISSLVGFSISKIFLYLSILFLLLSIIIFVSEYSVTWLNLPSDFSVYKLLEISQNYRIARIVELSIWIVVFIVTLINLFQIRSPKISNIFLPTFSFYLLLLLSIFVGIPIYVKGASVTLCSSSFFQTLYQKYPEYYAFFCGAPPLAPQVTITKTKVEEIPKKVGIKVEYDVQNRLLALESNYYTILTITNLYNKNITIFSPLIYYIYSENPEIIFGNKENGNIVLPSKEFHNTETLPPKSSIKLLLEFDRHKIGIYKWKKCPYSQETIERNLPYTGLKEVECADNLPCENNKKCVKIKFAVCKCLDWNKTILSRIPLRIKTIFNHTGNFVAITNLTYSETLTKPTKIVQKFKEGPLTLNFSFSPNPFNLEDLKFRRSVEMIISGKYRGKNLEIHDIKIEPIKTISSVYIPSKKILVREALGLEKIDCKEDPNDEIWKSFEKEKIINPQKICEFNVSSIEINLTYLGNKKFEELTPEEIEARTISFKDLPFYVLARYCEACYKNNTLQEWEECSKLIPSWQKDEIEKIRKNWQNYVKSEVGEKTFEDFIKDSYICELLSYKDILNELRESSVKISLNYTIEESFSSPIIPYAQ
ncbi:MAG: hypothetical protein B6U78_00370 [Candidatus Aenigmarchaeota archaeon ex4484_224]|nr:MAG: hypothetical protein B6U78_00370 [Candidatus Aenigmarchaeota archaeon ex4484_224]